MSPFISVVWHLFCFIKKFGALLCKRWPLGSSTTKNHIRSGLLGNLYQSHYHENFAQGGFSRIGCVCAVALTFWNTKPTNATRIEAKHKNSTFLCSVHRWEKQYASHYLPKNMVWEWNQQWINTIQGNVDWLLTICKYCGYWQHQLFESELHL